MKHLFSCILFCFGLSSFGQTEGVVIYEETMKLNIQLPPELADMVPKERKRKTMLAFNENESLYKNAPEKANVAKEIETQNGGGMHLRFQGMRNNNETYKNLNDDKIIEKQEFFGREFLISGQEKINWKMTGEQKKIGQYVCMKATYMRDTIPVTAWFTPQIPISNGPGNYGQLPGLILEVNVNNGTILITASDISLRPLTDLEKIVMPTKGKEVSREEFNKIRDEKMAEMKEMGGPGGGRFIIRGN